MYFQHFSVQTVKTIVLMGLLLGGMSMGWAAPLSPPATTEEAAALADVCSIVHAEELFKQFNYAYSGSFSEMQFLECDFSVPRNGYAFTLSLESGAYHIHADPVAGGRYFFANPTGFRVAEGAAAGPDSTLFDNPCGASLTCVDAVYETILANDISARQDICRILEAEWAYYAAMGQFAMTFDELTTSGPPYLEDDWSVARNGYTFALSGFFEYFMVNADPESMNISGFRGFFIDATGVMRFEIGASATNSSNTLNEGCMTQEAVAGNYEPILLDRICAIIQAEAMYYESNFIFATTFDTLTTPMMAGVSPFLEGDFSAVTLGYAFSLAGDSTNYIIYCEPEITTSTTPFFYADKTGTIRKCLGGPAGPEDAPVDTPCAEQPYPASRMIPLLIDNENAARARLLQILEAEYAYHRDTGCFAITFSELTTEGPPYLPDEDWGAPKNGYNFTLGGWSPSFSVNADPVTIPVTGRKGFFVDADGILRYAYGASADAASTPVPQGFAQGDMVAMTDDLALEYACSLGMAQDLFFQRHHRYGTFDDLSMTPAGQPWFGNYSCCPEFGYFFDLSVAEDGLSFQFRGSLPDFQANINVYTNQIGVVHYSTGVEAGPLTPAVIEPCSENPLGFSRLRRVLQENELAARDRMCVIFTAEQHYLQDHGTFTTSMDDLLSAMPPYLEPITPEPCGKGYFYTLSSDGTSFQVNADPEVMNLTGIFSYYMDETGVLRAVESEVADATSPEEGTVCTVESEGEGEADPGLYTADTNQDHLIDLGEVLRVVQFFNSGGYQCVPKMWRTEDGYEPGPGGSHGCTPHQTDYNPQDWAINLEELIRLIQFYNSGGYYHCPLGDTEDGFCPGPYKFI